MVGFYKMEPAVWDATTAALTLEEEAAYLRICNAIYSAERGCPALPRVLAGMFRCSTRKACSIVDSLIAKGKVYQQDGALMNEKAAREIAAIQKKKGKKNEPNTAPSGNEPDANLSPSSDEPDVNPERNDATLDDKSLKSAELSNGDDPPKTRLEEKKTREDLIKIAFEAFWKAYPRRRQECGSLTRGGKKAAFDEFKKLSAGDRQLAVDGLPGFTRLYPDDSRAVCDAVRYFTKQRWLDVEGIDDKPTEFIPWPKGEIRKAVQRLDKLIGRGSFKAWFLRNGRCVISERGDGVAISVRSDIAEREIRKRFYSELNTAFGFNNYVFVTEKKAAA